MSGVWRIQQGARVGSEVGLGWGEVGLGWGLGWGVRWGLGWVLG